MLGKLAALKVDATNRFAEYHYPTPTRSNVARNSCTRAKFTIRVDSSDMNAKWTVTMLSHPSRTGLCWMKLFTWTEEKGPSLLDPGPKVPHQEMLPLTHQRGEEAHGSGDIPMQILATLLGCDLAELGASPARCGVRGSPFRPERISQPGQS